MSITDLKVYIILVNYNGWQDTIECLESIFRLDHQNFEVIVVDNDSPNMSEEYLFKWAKGEIYSLASNPQLSKFSLPGIEKPIQFNYINNEKDLRTSVPSEKLTIIQAGANLGFAGANNIGIKFAESRGDYQYIWLLNNDTVIEPNALSNLIKFSNKDNNKRAGIIGSKLLYYHCPEKIQALGGRYNKWLGLSKHMYEGESAQALDASIIDQADYIVGAAMFLKRSFIQSVGLMNEAYFLYYEELDWAIRARNNGWSTATCTSSVVYHKEGASIGTGHWKKRSSMSDLYVFRNRFLFTSNFYPGYLISIYFFSWLIVLNRFRRGQADVGFKMINLLRSINIFRLKSSVQRLISVKFS